MKVVLNELEINQSYEISGNESGIKLESNDENENQIITDSRTHEMAVKKQTRSQTELSLNERNEDKNITFEESLVEKEMHFWDFTEELINENNSNAIILIVDKDFRFLINNQLIYFEEKLFICE